MSDSDRPFVGDPTRAQNGTPRPLSMQWKTLSVVCTHPLVCVVHSENIYDMMYTVICGLADPIL